MRKIVTILFAGLLLFTALLVLAQEEDLGVGEQRILPGTPFYFLKQAGRRLQEFLTFDPIKKLELKQRFASEKLAETRKLIKNGKNKRLVEQSIENYEQEQNEIRQRVEGLKQNAEENEEVRSFMEKYQHQVEIHSRALENMRGDAPPEIRVRIEEQREKHLERFRDVMMKLDQEENLPGRLEGFLNRIPDSLKQGEAAARILEQIQERVKSEEVKDELEEVKTRIRKEIRERVNQEQIETEENETEENEKVGQEQERQMCAQVITYCLDPATGECKMYPDACSGPKPCEPCLPSEVE